MDIEREAKDLVEALDDAFDEAVENFFVGFAERQYNDWLSSGGSEYEFSNVEDECLRRALEKITNRWKEAGQLW